MLLSRYLDARVLLENTTFIRQGWHNRGEFRFELTEFHRLLFAFCLVRSFVLEFDIFENRNLVVRELPTISKRCENIIAFSVQSYKFIRKLSMLKNPFKRKRLYPIRAITQRRDIRVSNVFFKSNLNIRGTNLYKTIKILAFYCDAYKIRIKLSIENQNRD